MPAKGRKELVKSADEADAASRHARRIVPFGRGELRRIKRRDEPAGPPRGAPGGAKGVAGRWYWDRIEQH
jgi:hypothetical protein